ncbi:hypothetical protein DFH06DRAFT_1261198 [Mycena polygramma]|nr:hypothetical protein DFH06DRAFT_1261198 [Mycena polygramma]
MSTSASTPILRLVSGIAWSLACIALMHPVKDDLAGLAVSLIASISATLLSSLTTSIPASVLASAAALALASLSASLAASVLPVLPFIVRLLRVLIVEDRCTEPVTVVYEGRRPLRNHLSLPIALMFAARLQFIGQAAARYPAAFSLLDATKDSGATAAEVDTAPEAAPKDLLSLRSSLYKCARFTEWTPATDKHRSASIQPDDESDITLVEHHQSPAEARRGSFILRADAPLFVPSSSPACRLNICANVTQSTVLQDRSLFVKAASSTLDPSAAIFLPSTTRFAQPFIPTIKNAAKVLPVQWARGGCLVHISPPPASPSSASATPLKVLPPLHVKPLLDADPSRLELSANIRARSPPPSVTQVKKSIADEDAARPGLRAGIWAPSPPASTAPDATRPRLSARSPTTSLPVTKENTKVESEDDQRPGLGASIWAPPSSAPATLDATRSAPSARIPSTSTSPPAATVKKDMEDDKQSGLCVSLHPSSPPAPTATSTARDADEDDKRPGLSASIWASATPPSLVKDKKIVADDDENRPGLSASIWASAPVPTYRAPRARQPSVLAATESEKKIA